MRRKICLKAILFFWCVSIDAAKQIKTYRVRYIPFGIYMCDCVRTRALSCIVLFVLFIFIYLFTFFSLFPSLSSFYSVSVLQNVSRYSRIHLFYILDGCVHVSVSQYIYYVYISQAMHIANVMIKKCVL